MKKNNASVIGYRCSFCQQYRMKNDGIMIPIKKIKYDENGEMELRDVVVLACPDCYHKIKLGVKAKDEDD